jgi:hypothetical protein
MTRLPLRVLPKAYCTTIPPVLSTKRPGFGCFRQSARPFSSKKTATDRIENVSFKPRDGGQNFFAAAFLR